MPYRGVNKVSIRRTGVQYVFKINKIDVFLNGIKKAQHVLSLFVCFLKSYLAALRSCTSLITTSATFLGHGE